MYDVLLFEYKCILLFFFFQAEDGIRDGTVTGVQTCALPISRPARSRDAALGYPLLALDRGARGAGARFGRGRRGDDRRRQHRRCHARDDHRHCARDLERRSAARAVFGHRADGAGAAAQRRRLRGQGSRAKALWMSSILPLVLRDVSFAAGGRSIIERVSFELLQGPRTVILGANGAGKSVLMRLMHGLLVPTQGQILWKGENPARKQAMVFHRPVMLRRSALANVVYALKLAGVNPPE